MWWASPAGARPAHLALLDLPERARHDRLRRQPDRDRFVVGVALARLVLGGHLGVGPTDVRLDRTCPSCGGPHGKPKVSATRGLELSVSHAGEWVAVAVARSHAIGVDVERIDQLVDLAGLIEQVLTPAERRELAAAPPELQRAGFFRYWSRKEAIVKATGDGLREPLAHVCVSAPHEPPRLRHWDGRLDLSVRVHLADLMPRAGHTASLASLDAALEIAERDGSELLAQWP